MEIAARTMPNQQALPAKTAAPFVLTMVGAYVATAALLAAGVVLLNRSDLWRTVLAAGVIGALATSVSIVPILYCLNRSMRELVLAFFVASGMRMLITLTGLLLAIRGGHYPAVPMGVSVMPFYFTALVAECIFLMRLMRRLRQPVKGK